MSHSRSFNSSTPSLLRSTDELHVVIADSKGNFGAMHQHIDSLNLRFRKRLHIVYNATIDRKAYRDANADKQALLRKRQAAELISAGEYASITALHNYCTAKVKEGTRAYVYYFHNKGGCCPKYPPSPVSDWRDEMNAFALEFPSICMRALNEGYSTCVSSALLIAGCLAYRVTGAAWSTSSRGAITTLGTSSGPTATMWPSCLLSGTRSTTPGKGRPVLALSGLQSSHSRLQGR